jgi:Type II secretion system (T2SS), protein E, N-terminal domain
MLALDVYKDWLGIPEGPRPPDHYQLLRLVEFEDSADKVRANYKKLNAHVRRYATGQYSIESQTLLNELAKAMLCLTDLERKREYDVSLGRVFEEKQGGPRTMDAILIEQNHISPSQAKEAREYAERTGLDLRDAFVQLKIVEPDVAARALADELGLPFVDLADLIPEDEVLDQVPKQTVKQHSILPLFIDQGRLIVACVRLIDHELEDELRLRFGIPVRNVLAAPLAITQAIAKHYAPGARNEGAASSAGKETEDGKKGSDKKADAKKGDAKKTAEKAASKSRREPKTDEEIRQDKMIGIIIINFSFLAAYLLDWLVFTPGAFFFDGWTSWLLFTTIPGIAGLVAWLMFLKK